MVATKIYPWSIVQVIGFAVALSEHVYKAFPFEKLSFVILNVA